MSVAKAKAKGRKARGGGAFCIIALLPPNPSTFYTTHMPYTQQQEKQDHL
jgi:hypothetical protein